MTTDQTIKVSMPDGHGIVVITICRPEQMNALTEAEHNQLATIWSTFNHRRDVRCVIITGEGRAFSAGGDMEFMSRVAVDDATRADAWWAARNMVKGILDCRKPIIAAVEGVSIGAGNAIAMTADVCVVAETAKIIEGHLPFATSPGDHAAVMWPLAMGINRARGRLLLGKPMTGAEAAELGLVYEAVPRGTTLERAHELAREIAQLDPHAVEATKVSVNGIIRDHWQSIEVGLALEFMCFSNQPVRDAIRAAAGGE